MRDQRCTHTFNTSRYFIIGQTVDNLILPDRINRAVFELRFRFISGPAFSPESVSRSTMEHIYCIIGLLIIVPTLLYYHLTSTFGYWKQRRIPCPKGTYLGLGHVHPMIFMKQNMGDMFRDLYNRMPGCSMIGFYHLRDSSLLVREPKLVKTVLLKSFQNFG